MHVRPLLELQLRRIEAPECATPGARVYVLLPPLDGLLSAPGFGERAPILFNRAACAIRYSAAHIPRQQLH